MSGRLVVDDAPTLEAARALDERARDLRAALLRLSSTVTRLYESGAIDGPGVRGRLEARAQAIARAADAVPSAASQLLPDAAAFVSDLSALDDLFV